MKRAKKVLALTTAVLLLAGSLSACAGSNTTTSTGSGSSGDAAATEIYFLNFKPEIADVYKQVADTYKQETGVTVNVVTAASNTYEQTLRSEIAKADAPTIFQINGPVGYQTWKDYCADLKDTDLYKHLTDKSLAVTSGDGVYGVPYAVEGYGIIYNDAIMKKYFALSDKAVSISSTDQINSFATLKSVVEDMTAKKSELGIEGVFASTSFSSGEDWRWQTHLLSMPLGFEFAENKSYDSTVLAGLATPNITFKYADNYKQIFDLYLNNSTTQKTLLGSKSVDDSMAEFALGQCAMVQNGNWGWSQIDKVDGNVVSSDDVKMMPIYMGGPDESKQGLCVGTENYFAINSKVSEAKQKASIDFLNWLFSSDKGKSYVTKDLGFIAPFDTFSDSEKPTDPLAKQVLAWMAKDGVTSVPWTFQCFPDQTFKDNVGGALLQYAQGSETWDQVKQTVIDQWKTEYAASQSAASSAS